MSTAQHYNQWSATYDTMANKTRDLEKMACQKLLANHSFDILLELGCGTGKNTSWLAEKARRVVAVDFSEGMLQKAKRKVQQENVAFMQADITQPWLFAPEKIEAITCSLILEHIRDLDFVFSEASKKLSCGGWFYICELHPYKQYAGGKARYETEQGSQVLECFVHRLSDYTEAAQKHGFTIAALEEWFDEDNRNHPPRLISFLFRYQDIQSGK